MGYLIRRLTSGPRPWKLQFVEYTGTSTQKIRDIPATEFGRLGFRQEMSVGEAQARKEQLNDQAHLVAVEAKRAAIARRIEKDDKAINAFLNPIDVADFEDTVLFVTSRDKKLPSVWRAARKLIAKLKIPPQEWDYRQARFYEEFIAQRVSVSWAQKVIMVINRWGEYQAMKYGFYFKPLQFPRGIHEHRISDAYFEKSPKGRASEPLTLETLNKVSGKIREDWFNWFYLTIWFGLRPSEVDRLHQPQGQRTWWIGEARTTEGEVAVCLFLYQKKLVKLPPDKRVKVIPIICKEQRTGLEIIRSGNFARPSATRFIRPYFPDRVMLYGGRKGFSKLMRSLGQQQRDYSRWLGHTTIDRTERDYEERLVVDFNRVPGRRSR